MVFVKPLTGGFAEDTQAISACFVPDATATPSEKDIARLSPLGDAPINMPGRYAFTAWTTDGLRPLRIHTATDPDAQGWGLLSLSPGGA